MRARQMMHSSVVRGIVIAAGLTVLAVSSPHADGPTQFTPGTLLVSRSVYVGTPGSVTLPGLLPNNAAAVADGTFPSVFNNETPDASFGITSPIYVDQMTTGGVLVSSQNITDLAFNQLGVNAATSFPSKSELGLSLTPDASGVAFAAYGSAVNQLDVSNANTPGHVDITNPVNGRGVLLNQRNIIELSGNGTLQVTTTNTYSGNNARNVVLGSNGNYFIAGNAGNNGKSASFKAGTVTIAASSTSVALSGASTTANMYVGTPFSGTNIPVGAYVTSIDDATHFHLSASATGSASGAYTADEGSIQLFGISFGSGATNITVGDTSNLVPGMPLAGTGFAAGSCIQSIPDATHFVANVPTTSSATPSTVSYTAGVSNSMLSDDTGVQMIAKGSNDTTGTSTGNLNAITASTVVGKVNGAYGTGTGYQRGFSITQIGAAADKTGKDDNFRGLLDYKDTLYVSKGSGGNGFDAVYQVNPAGGGYLAPGTSAGLPNSGNAATASINPLPGWPTTSTGANESKVATSPIVHHPFGMWFANDTTLYVADEGAAGVTNASPGGLQKWTYNAGTSQWELKYTLAASSIPGYNIAGVGTLQAQGLRNISGVDNGDGTVTLYAITSTTGQTLNDEGADPNQLVSITDSLTAATLPGESFTVLRTAAYGEVLRGVAFVVGTAQQPTVSYSGFVRDRRTGRFGQQLTIQNLTAKGMPGPVYAVLDNLSANANLVNGNGTVANNPPTGGPYILVSSGGIPVGASVSVALQFTNPASQSITYVLRILSGIIAP